MHLTELNPELQWSGQLTIDGGWGPKDLVRQWAADIEGLSLRPQANVLGLDDVLSVSEKNRTSVSTKVVDQVFSVNLSSPLLQKLAEFLQQLVADGYDVTCTLDEVFSPEGPNPGQDVRRLVLEGEKNETLRIAQFFAHWTPLFDHQYPDLYYQLEVS